ncbi:MAG: GNAT family N-acetyltransferase [Mycobacteriales bacterium]|jgi:RimJ/RimL family protein N-acetyltransferase
MGEVGIREVADGDLAVFFEHQRDPEATAMAAFPARDWDVFLAHWNKIRADESTLNRTVLVDGAVAGNMASWPMDGERFVGYWIGREYWGRGVATAALGLFLDEEPVRPLYAHVALHNAGSIRVLEKCGFARTPDAPVGGDDGVEEVTLVLK